MRRWTTAAMLASLAACISGLVIGSDMIAYAGAGASAAVFLITFFLERPAFAAAAAVLTAACASLGMAVYKGEPGMVYYAAMLCVAVSIAWLVCGAASLLPHAFLEERSPGIPARILALVFALVAACALAWPLVAYLAGEKGIPVDDAAARIAEIVCMAAIPALICACSVCRSPVTVIASICAMLFSAAYRPSLFPEIMVTAFAASIAACAGCTGPLSILMPFAVPGTAAALLYTGMVHADAIVPALNKPEWLMQIYLSRGWPGIAGLGAAFGAAAFLAGAGIRQRVFASVPCMALCVYGVRYLCFG
ncbi:MAG: hypothetical protein J5859_04430, partial [Clostridia bacterium]|nr:hypothetical protein [Clostridia bacterium]